MSNVERSQAEAGETALRYLASTTAFSASRPEASIVTANETLNVLTAPRAPNVPFIVRALHSRFSSAAIRAVLINVASRQQAILAIVEYRRIAVEQCSRVTYR